MCDVDSSINGLFGSSPVAEHITVVANSMLGAIPFSAWMGASFPAGCFLDCAVPEFVDNPPSLRTFAASASVARHSFAMQPFADAFSLAPRLGLHVFKALYAP